VAGMFVKINPKPFAVPFQAFEIAFACQGVGLHLKFIGELKET
jgi:hypothetical protein